MKCPFVITQDGKILHWLTAARDADKRAAMIAKAIEQLKAGKAYF